MGQEGVRRLAAGVLLPGFAGTSLSARHVAWLREGLGGVALFGENIADAEQVRALTAAVRQANPSAVVAIDEEGGDVTRLHMRQGSPEPGNAVLGRIDRAAVTTASAVRIGTELADVGVTLDLAPTVDVNTNADNPVIGARSFGTDAGRVAAHARAWVLGLQSTGVWACAKHFPGHGDTAVDSHIGLPVVEHTLDALRQRELVPFAAAIDAGVGAVMTSHILLPQLDPGVPATRSRRILTGLLRQELGFEGVIVTDALDMAGASADVGIPAAAVQALTAGADLLCLGRESEPHIEPVLEAIVAAVGTGELSVERLEEAVRRVRRLASPSPRASLDLAGEEADPAGAFDVRPGAAAQLAEPGGWTVVRLESLPNTAVGVTGWGPFAAAAHDPAAAEARLFAGWPRIVGDPGSPIAAVAGRALVIGRDIHRHPNARAVVDRLRGSGAVVVVVDMGWPSADRRYADVATFGSSRAVGAALLRLVTAGERHPPTRPRPAGIR